MTSRTATSYTMQLHCQSIPVNVIIAGIIISEVNERGILEWNVQEVILA